MQLVSELPLYPAVCAVTQRDDTAAERFLDTEASLKGQRIYLSESAINVAASLLDFVDKETHGKLQQALDEVQKLYHEALDEVAQLEAELEAVHILRRRQYSPEQKRGPKAAS